METEKAGKTTKGLEPARATDLRGLVQRAEGSIVSRVLLRTTQGSVTVFSFDEGQSLSEHTNAYEALAQVLEGSVELTIGGKPVTVKTGEAAVLPAGVPHAVRALEPLKMLLTMIRP